jgi:hypothetical protein
MSILVNPDVLVLSTIELATRPPPPADLNSWAEDNIVFGRESWAPGRYSGDTIPQLRRLLDVLSPDHAATVVTVRGAAQIFKTTVAQIFIGGRMDIDPCDIGYVHPSHDNAIRWARRKWKVMRKASLALRRIFGEQKSRDSTDTTLYQETRDGLGSACRSPAPTRRPRCRWCPGRRRCRTICRSGRPTTPAIPRSRPTAAPARSNGARC